MTSMKFYKHLLQCNIDVSTIRLALYSTWYSST